MEKHTFSDDDRLYLQMMQDNITRMAINSTNCKSWMVMLMSGFLRSLASCVIAASTSV